MVTFSRIIISVAAAVLLSSCGYHSVVIEKIQPTAKPQIIDIDIKIDAINKNPEKQPEKPMKTVLNKKTIHYVFDDNSSKTFSWWKSVTEDAIGIWNKDLGYIVFSRESGETKLFIRYVDKTGEKTDNGITVGRLFGFRTKSQTIEFFKTKNRHREIALHELGHSIGLDHSIDKNDLMYETVTAQQYPSANDIAMAKLHIFIGGSSD